jgi:hypothetical protein
MIFGKIAPVVNGKLVVDECVNDAVKQPHPTDTVAHEMNVPIPSALLIRGGEEVVITPEGQLTP